MMPLLNHFVYETMGQMAGQGILIPDAGNIDLTNDPSENSTDVGAFGLHATTCGNVWGMKPVFVLVDFWDRGPAMRAVDRMNGVEGRTVGRINPVPMTDGTPARFGNAHEGVGWIVLLACFVFMVCML